MAPAVPETDILHQRDPSLDDETDAWAEFTLSHAYVHLPGEPTAIRSLLEASAGYPLAVTGQLEPLDEEDAHLYKQQAEKKRVNIIVEDVKTFSYGQYGDGSYAIWAAGKAGWFALKPAKKYKATFEAMTEAVGMLYFVADSYREPRKKGKGRNAQVLPDYSPSELFEKYAAEELGSGDVSDGVEKIYEHKEFLISSMIAGKEGLAWSKYPIYKHMYAKFPDLFAELRQRIAGPAVEEKESGKSRHKRQSSEDTISSLPSAARKKGRKGRGAIEVISLDGTSDASSAGKGSKKKSDEPTAQSRTGASKAKSAPRRTRQNSVVDQEDEDEANDAEAMATPTKDDDTDEEIRLRSRKNKSSLRPRASKASKSAGRTGAKGPTADEDDDAGPPSSPMAGKRKSDDADTLATPLKRRHSRPHDDEGIDIPTSPSVSGDADNAPTPDIPLGETSELVLRGLAHAPDQAQEDTWICRLDGCSHKVYAASEPDSQKLIREHYKLHAFDEDERVQMVKKLAAPSLPTSHLLERVKMHAKEEAFPGSRQMSSRYPSTLPVVQKY